MDTLPGTENEEQDMRDTVEVVSSTQCAVSGTVVLWVRLDGEWHHGTESEDAMAVELVGVAVLAAGADEAMICAADEHPDQIEYVLTEFEPEVTS